MSETLATDDLATRIRAVAGLREQATPGPWSSDEAERGLVCMIGGVEVTSDAEPVEGALNDAAFIAAAGSLPWDELAAAVEFGAAWQRAERALPEGWGIWSVEHMPNDAEGPWVATVGAVPAETPKEMAWVYGSTPTAALTALAEKLETGR